MLFMDSLSILPSMKIPGAALANVLGPEVTTAVPQPETVQIQKDKEVRLYNYLF